MKRARLMLLGATALTAGVAVSLVASRWAMACHAPVAPAYSWRLAAAAPAWAPGYSFDLIPFRTELWIFGAGDGNWRSPNGVDWTAAPANTDFDGLECEFAALADEVYAVGTGAGDPAAKPRVWRSGDGLTWSVVTDNPPWTARRWPELVSHEGKLWLLGGHTPAGTDLHDVWSSGDGAIWTSAVETAPWHGRSMFSAVSFGGSLWVMGGRANMDSAFESDFNDVWSSPDGVAWRKVVGGADWSKRYGAAATAWDGRLWIMGGTRFGANNEVWSSSDGARWTRHAGDHFGPRFLGGAAVFGDGLWVAGGKLGGGVFTNQVWTLQRAVP